MGACCIGAVVSGYDFVSGIFVYQKGDADGRGGTGGDGIDGEGLAGT